MKIWAHRGCSQRYPENTLVAFEKAARLQGLAGIELDIQLTKDGEMVVFHDERVDRTTDGTGYVREYTLAQLKKLKIDAGKRPYQSVPTMEEVFELLAGKLRTGLKLNIELKNSIVPYDGMEEKIVELVHNPVKLAETLGISTLTFPNVEYPGTPVTFIRPELAARLGVSETAQVVVSSYDAICSFVGSGGSDDGEASDVSGTVTVFRTLSKKKI